MQLTASSKPTAARQAASLQCAQSARRCRACSVAALPLGAEDASRRALLAALALSAALPVSRAAAAELPDVTARLFFDVAVDGAPVGRVVVGLHGSGAAPLCARRFLELATGASGVGYRRTAVDSLQATYVKAAGIRTFSYAEGELGTTLAGGESARSLWAEADSESALPHDREGLVSLLVRPTTPSEPPKERLVAVRGALTTVLEATAPLPNGTGFVFTMGAATELDGGVGVVVGQVLDGMDVVRAIAALPSNRNADEAGALFAVAKAIGDKRALVRGKASGKPLAKVTFSACGLIE